MLFRSAATPGRSRLWWRLIPIAIGLAVVGYQYLGSDSFTNPETGRPAHLGLSQDQETALGMQAFQEVTAQSQVITSGPAYDQVVRVTKRLAGAVASDQQLEWQVAVLEDPQQNAFCLPGGKICVYTGILVITQSDAGLAVVLGHEMAHATCHHGAERVLHQNMTQAAMMGVQGSMSDLDYTQQRAIMGVIGAGAQFGVLLPFSRSHESEADYVGLKYLVRAGYDPEEAARFWTRMAESTQGGSTPEFMSTHPLHETRIRQIKEWIPKIVASEQTQRVPEAAGTPR